MTERQGPLGYQRADGVEHFAGVGETVRFKPGDMHRYWHAGADDLHCTGYIEPVDNIEYFLSEIFASQARSGSTRRELFDGAGAWFSYPARAGPLPAWLPRCVIRHHSVRPADTAIARTTRPIRRVQRSPTAWATHARSRQHRWRSRDCRRAPA
jgi:hypothetical protein